jgi:hypothetical protein
MISMNVDQPRKAVILPEHVAGSNAYAITIMGDLLAPTVRDGQNAVFDPDAGRPSRGDVVALWLHGKEQPFFVRLARAMPPLDVPDGALAIETKPGFWRPLPMARVRAAHRLVWVEGRPCKQEHDAAPHAAMTELAA